jgi:hypothetical protein
MLLVFLGLLVHLFWLSVFDLYYLSVVLSHVLLCRTHFMAMGLSRGMVGAFFSVF